MTNPLSEGSDLAMMVSMVGRHIRENVSVSEPAHSETHTNDALEATIVWDKLFTATLGKKRRLQHSWSKSTVPLSVVSAYAYAVSDSGDLLEWNPFLRESKFHAAGCQGGWVRRSVSDLPPDEHALAHALLYFHVRNLGLLQPAY